MVYLVYYILILASRTGIEHEYMMTTKLSCIIIIVSVIFCCGAVVDMSDNDSYKQPHHRQLTTYTRCPVGFVIPDHPSDPDVEYAADSNCAIGCKSPILAPDNWDSASGFVRTVNLIGLVCIFFLFLSTTSRYSGRGASSDSHILVVIISLFSGLSTIITFVQRQRPFEDQFCRDNAVPLSAEDGVSMCAVDSWINMCTGFGLALAWARQSFQIMWVLAFRKPAPLSDRTMVALLVLTPLIIDIVAFSSEVQGYSRGNLFCFTSGGAGNGDIYYFFMPIFVVGCFGVLFMCAAIYQIIGLLKVFNKPVSVHPERVGRGHSFEGGDDNSASAGGQLFGSATASEGNLEANASVSEKQAVTLWSSLRALYLPIMFVAFFMFCVCGLVIGRAEVWAHAEARALLFDEWVICVFDNYDGSTDPSWQAVCGEEPADDGVNLGIGVWFGLAAVGHSIFVTIAFFRYKEIWNRILSIRKSMFSGSSKQYDDVESPPSYLEFDADSGMSGKVGADLSGREELDSDADDYVHDFNEK